MKFKKTIMSVVAGLSMLTLAGTAMAVNHDPSWDINIYGSSAQYNYWSAAAAAFLKAPAPPAGEGLGCASATTYTLTSGAAALGNNHFIAIGTGCPVSSSGPDQEIIIRGTTKSSQDGVESMLGLIPDSGTEYDTSCPDQFSRYMADETTVTGSTFTKLKCVRVTLGCADVAGMAITQSSTGCLYGDQDVAACTGPGTTDWTIRDFAKGINPSGLTDYNQAVVVPMGFYVNNSVKRCADTNGFPADWNTYCATSHSGYTASTLSNMTRMMAAVIFGQQVTSWSDLGQDFNSQPIIVCHRHAGSGTLATFYQMVFKGTNQALPVLQESDAGGHVFFNDGTGNELNCINNTNGVANMSAAIGYADGDNVKKSSNCVAANWNSVPQWDGNGVSSSTSLCQGTPSYPNISAITYQGIWPTAYTTRNCQNDFYSNQDCYESPATGNLANPTFATTDPEVQLLMNTFAADENNMPTAVAPWYTVQNSMQCEKVDDFTYPGFVGANDRQDP